LPIRRQVEVDVDDGVNVDGHVNVKVVRQGQGREQASRDGGWAIAATCRYLIV
jgi:hypothetical protein